MQIKIDKGEVIVRFDNDFSDVTEYLGARRGIIKTTVPYLYNGGWTYLLYEIAYYELDLEHIYSTYELGSLVKNGKVILLSSRPYFCIKESDTTKEENIYTEENLTTLQEYNPYMVSRNSTVNNELVLNMLKKQSEQLSQYCKKREKALLKK